MEVLKMAYIFTNDYGVGELIFVSAMRLARENKHFSFKNIGRTKLQNIWRRFDKEVKIIELNEQRGNDMTKARKALEKVYWQLIEA